jgi:amidase
MTVEEGTQSGGSTCVAPRWSRSPGSSVPIVDLQFATATELLGALRERRLSSRELLEHLLSRIEEHNPALNAVVALDVERARTAADAADTVTASSPVVPPLHGLPMTVKDVWETAGLVTTSGAPELRHYVPEHDALTVSRLRAAGAVVFGKTNTPLYAGDLQTFNQVYGVTNNPWDTSRTTGGSSGGAAAAVAAGLTPVELGSDIGGSIRNPAHFNGVYGLKPSWGIVPSRGHIPGPPGSLVEPDVNCGGPLARSIDDLGLVLDVVAGPLPEEAVAWRLELEGGPRPEPDRLRVATVFHEGADLLPLSAAVRSGLGDFADRLAEAGVTVDPVALPVPLADGLRSWQELVLPIIGSALPDDVYTAFAQLESLQGEDPAMVAGRSLAGRYRSWAWANGLRL